MLVRGPLRAVLYLFKANYNFVATHGAMAVFDGGILQFLELTASG